METTSRFRADDSILTGSQSLDNALYRELRIELQRAGCFEPTPWFLAAYMTCVLAAYVACYAILLRDPGAGVRLAALLALAAVSVHAGLIAHEAGHGTVTRNQRLAMVVGELFGTLLAGLCFISFQRVHHRLHHAHSNDPAQDPDLRCGPISLDGQAAWRQRGAARWITRHQGTLIWGLVWLQAFKIKLDGCRGLLHSARPTWPDPIVLALHLVLWFGVASASLGFWDALLNYLLATCLAGPYLAAIFWVNHVGMRLVPAEEKLSFMQQQLATSRDVGTSRLADLLFGGLNHHIEHHLFPSLPMARLRAARPIVRDYCRQHGLAYRETSWHLAMKEVFAHFRAMARIAREQDGMGPFERHLHEAIEINRTRAPIYAALSGGASRRLSRALLLAQHLCLPLARQLDHRAAPYHRAGIPLLEQVFVSMEQVRPVACTPPHAPPAGYHRPDPGQIRRRVLDAYRLAGFPEASMALADEIAALSRQSCLDCMLRHLLESALRACNLATPHAAAARQAGLPPPTPISEKLLRLHLWGLAGAAWLDAAARPLQLNGIPIVCHDLPPIPPWPDRGPSS